DLQDFHRLDRRDGRGARRLVYQRHLAEKVERLQRADDRFAVVAAEERDLDASAEDDAEIVAAIALLKDDAALRIPFAPRGRGDARELFGRELRAQRHVLQDRNRIHLVYPFTGASTVIVRVSPSPWAMRTSTARNGFSRASIFSAHSIASTPSSAT